MLERACDNRPMDLSPWEKKTVTLEWAGLKLPFRVAQELFSSHEIDQGTKLLLRPLDHSALPADPVVLDFGCGYGPLGLAVKARTPRSEEHTSELQSHSDLVCRLLLE